ncbi:unnamed protein product [Enterobius vermicularis]|uniref:ShKT domain-containing protein n=1 Tax=Enterobius vermicularis TaxID=51028 RepID=A0A0N4UWK6_ENTVE|nr:unnamed protein product [Enterobius vermicularis]
MCINDSCVLGCYDTCTDCKCYTGYCHNPMYKRCMQCCHRTCGTCEP